jgi:hypothetical protein
VNPAYERYRALLTRGTVLGNKAYVAGKAAFMEFVSALQQRTPSLVEAFEFGWLAACLHPTCHACLGLDAAIDRLFEKRLGTLAKEAREIDAELTRLEELGRDACDLADRGRGLPPQRSISGMRVTRSPADRIAHETLGSAIHAIERRLGAVLG